MRPALVVFLLLVGSEASAQPVDPMAGGVTDFTRPAVRPDIYPTQCGEREEADVEAAKGLHRAAKLHFSREHYAEALDAWTASYRFDCSAHSLLMNIATAYERLNDVVGARRALGQYLARAAEPYASGAVEKYRRLLAQPVLRRLPDPVMPAETPTVPAPRVPLGPWVTLGVGAGVGLAGVALFTAGAVKTQQSCPDAASLCTRVEQQDAEAGIDFQHAGGALMVVGLTSMATAGVWAWTALRETSEDGGVGMSVSVGPTHVTLMGSF